MANKFEIIVLNSLLDKYERSKSFLGQNKNEQNFKIYINKEFPKYEDDSEYEYFKDVNTSLDYLETKEYVTLSKERSGKINAVFLNTEKLEDIYKYLKRKPKAEINSNIQDLLTGYIQLSKEIYSPLIRFAEEQIENIKKNKKVQYFDDDYQEFSDVLVLTKAVLENEEEIFVRELSVRLFNDSKRLEKLETKVRGLLFNYGDYDDKDTVFEEHNIIKTPTYVMVKGSGVLDFGQQKIDLTQLEGDIGLSTQTLKRLKSVNLNGSKVVTIENLTNFHRYNKSNELVVYLGGFHNQIKRDFIKLVKQCNPKANFYHFGDIDAGGFYILEHLSAKTGIDFKSVNMDIQTLEQNKDNWIKLTDNDRKRFLALKAQKNKYDNIIDFMLQNNCKLEQEAEL